MGWRTAYIDFCKTRPEGEPTTPDGRSHALMQFYLREIVGQLSPSSLPESYDEIDDCYTDGSNDLDADLIHRSDEGLVTIFQFRYHGKSKDVEFSDFDYFAGILERLHPVAGKDYEKNHRLQKACRYIDWENDHFELVYVAAAKVAARLRTRESKGISAIPSEPEIEDRCTLRLIDNTNLNRDYRDAQDAEGKAIDSIELILAASEGEEPWITYSTGDRTCYMGCVAANQLQALEARYTRRLFSLNVRDWLGNVKINKGIRDTAKEEPANFFYYNNGISCVAHTVVPDVSSRTLTCKGFSIINGAQTVKSLAMAARHDPSGKASEAMILIRVIETSLGSKSKDIRFLECVTKFNNNQNAVKPYDFLSNHTIQRQLAKRFEKLNRGGKKYWYKNKRSGEKKKFTHPIKLDEFIKTLFSYEHGPFDADGGTPKLFDLEGGYSKLFGDEHGPWEVLDDAAFDSLAGKWFLCEAILNNLKDIKNELPPDETLGLERKYHVFWAVGELIRTVYQQYKPEHNLEHDIHRLAKPAWLDESSGPLEAVAEFAEEACDRLRDVYDVACEKEGFKHRNWFRSENTLASYRKGLTKGKGRLKKMRCLFE